MAHRITDVMITLASIGIKKNAHRSVVRSRWYSIRMADDASSLLLFVLTEDVGDVINGTFEVFTGYDFCNNSYSFCYYILLFQTVIPTTLLKGHLRERFGTTE